MIIAPLLVRLFMLDAQLNNYQVTPGETSVSKDLNLLAIIHLDISRPGLVCTGLGSTRAALSILQTPPLFTTLAGYNTEKPQRYDCHTEYENVFRIGHSSSNLL